MRNGMYDVAVNTEHVDQFGGTDHHPIYFRDGRGYHRSGWVPTTLMPILAKAYGPYLTTGGPSDGILMRIGLRCVLKDLLPGMYIVRREDSYCWSFESFSKSKGRSEIVARSLYDNEVVVLPDHSYDGYLVLLPCPSKAALQANPNVELALAHETYASGDSLLRVRRNGKLQEWVTEPKRFRLPIKVGFKGYADITNDNRGYYVMMVAPSL